MIMNYGWLVMCLVRFVIVGIVFFKCIIGIWKLVFWLVLIVFMYIF